MQSQCISHFECAKLNCRGRKFRLTQWTVLRQIVLSLGLTNYWMNDLILCLLALTGGLILEQMFCIQEPFQRPLKDVLWVCVPQLFHYYLVMVMRWITHSPERLQS